MGSSNRSGWRQSLPLPAEEGKTPETYPTPFGTAVVFRQTRYCCHTDTATREEHKTFAYTNAEGNITDAHTPNESGICSHCGADVRRPVFRPETAKTGKVGEMYELRIDTSETPLVSEYALVTSETDDTPFLLPDGLSAEASRRGDYFRIYGVPRVSGTFSFVLKATNAGGTSYARYTLVIEESDALAIRDDEKLPNATAAETYFYQLDTNLSLPTLWTLAEGSALPVGLTLDATSGEITGVPTTPGRYTFTVSATVGEQHAEKTFTLVVLEEGGCRHGDMAEVPALPATCKKDGRKAYYHCNICECDFFDAEGKREVWSKDLLTTAETHTDADGDGKCDFCQKKMPVFRKVTGIGDIVYGGTYVLITKIGETYYALTVPTLHDSGREYDGLMPLCEVVAQENGDFTFSSLQERGALMLDTAFTAECGVLDAGAARFGLSAILDHTRYGFSSDGSPVFWMYPNEAAKYGYRLTLNAAGEALIGSVYQEYWQTAGAPTGDGLLRAYDVTHDGKRTNFMSFFAEGYYTGESGAFGGGEMTEYPIYLYRMTDVGETKGGITFVSNDTSDTVSKGDFGLPDIVDLSNVDGIADAVREDYLEAVIDENAAGNTEVATGFFTAITVVDLGKNADGTAIVSVKYSVTPSVTVTDRSGNVLYEGVLPDDGLNGAPIRLMLYVGRIVPAQIVHYKENGTEEYFYPEHSAAVEDGAKSFSYDEESGFVTFTIDSFSEIEILSTARPETSGTDPGENPGGDDPSENPGGDNPGENPGTDDPSENPGGDDPSENPGEDPGTDTPAPSPEKNTGIGVGGIVGISIGAVCVVGISGFSFVWFVIRKKTFAELIAAIKALFGKK